MIRERSGEVESCSVAASTSIEARSGHGPLFESDGSFAIDWRDQILRAGDPETLSQEQAVTDRPLTAHGVCRRFQRPGELLIPCRRRLILTVRVGRTRRSPKN